MQAADKAGIALLAGKRIEQLGDARRLLQELQKGYQLLEHMLMRRTGKLLFDMVDDIVFNFNQERVDIPIVKIERAAVDIGPRTDIGYGDVG